MFGSRAAVLALTCWLAAVACAPQPPRAVHIGYSWDYRVLYPGRRSDHVELYIVQRPTRRYRVLGTITVNSASHSHALLLDRLRQEAAYAGADAVIHITRTITGAGKDYVVVESRYPQFHVSGVVIQWTD